MSSSKPHEILVLGGNFGGVSVSHYLLKQTFPALASISNSQSYHITMVSPSTHYFFKIAGPRVLVNPHLIPFSKVMLSIPDAFSSYPSSQFTFVQGTATAVDSSSRTATISLHDNSSPQNLKYDTLVLATGTTAHELWTLNGPHSLTEAAHSKLHTSLPKAKTILIAGGGAAGTETTGELVENYPSAHTTILSGSTRLLPRLTTATSALAEKRLQEKGVTVVHNLRVASHTTTPSGQTDVHFSDGSKKTVDVYIDATGGTPNTGFLPKAWLDANNKIKTDPVTLRGSGPDMSGIYAIGDAASYSKGGALDVADGVRPITSSIGADLAALLPQKPKVDLQPKGWFASWFDDTPKALKPKAFSTLQNTQFVPLGSKGGVGQLMGWGMPSLLVWMGKARHYLLPMAEAGVKGMDYVKP